MGDDYYGRGRGGGGGGFRGSRGRGGGGGRPDRNGGGGGRGYGAPRGGGGGPMRGYGGGGDSYASDNAYDNASSYNNMMASPLDAEIQIVMTEIEMEQNLFMQSGEWGDQFKNAKRLLATEFDKLEHNIDPEWLEVDIDKPIKVTRKILVPTFRHPNFNYVGKILGPKGVHLQNLIKAFKCHIYVLGRGSTKDRRKEQELLATGDPQYSHYGGPLHIKVETVAPAKLAYTRVAGVIEELSELLQPVREVPELTAGGIGNNIKRDDGNSDDEANKDDGDGSDDRGRSSRGRGGGDRRGGGRGFGRGGRGRGGGDRGNRPY